jgi:hypothetical protein
MSAHVSPLPRLRERGWGRSAFVSVRSQETRRFRAPAGARVTSPLLVQRRSNQEETTPRLALAGPPARQVREAGPGFSSGLLPARKGESIPGLARCAASSSPPHRRPGAPEEQARFLRARNNSKSGVPRICKTSSPSPACREGSGWSGIASARRERAALPGAPMARRAGGGKSAGWLAGMRASFSPGQESRRKTPPPARAPAGQDARRARHRGAVSLWLLSLWASKEKVARLPAGRRNRFETCERAETKAPLTPTLSLNDETVGGEDVYQAAPSGIEDRTSHRHAQGVAHTSTGAQP